MSVVMDTMLSSLVNLIFFHTSFQKSTIQYSLLYHTKTCDVGVHVLNDQDERLVLMSCQILPAGLIVVFLTVKKIFG